jgi:hypothetical protein
MKSNATLNRPGESGFRVILVEQEHDAGDFTRPDASAPA